MQNAERSSNDLYDSGSKALAPEDVQHASAAEPEPAREATNPVPQEPPKKKDMTGLVVGVVGLIAVTAIVGAQVIGMLRDSSEEQALQARIQENQAREHALTQQQQQQTLQSKETALMALQGQPEPAASQVATPSIALPESAQMATPATASPEPAQVGALTTVSQEAEQEPPRSLNAEAAQQMPAPSPGYQNYIAGTPVVPSAQALPQSQATPAGIVAPSQQDETLAITAPTPPNFGSGAGAESQQSQAGTQVLPQEFVNNQQGAQLPSALPIQSVGTNAALFIDRLDAASIAAMPRNDRLKTLQLLLAQINSSRALVEHTLHTLQRDGADVNQLLTPQQKLTIVQLRGVDLGAPIGVAP